MFTAPTHFIPSGHGQHQEAMVVCSIACLGRDLKHPNAGTGILMPRRGSITVQKSPGRRAGLAEFGMKRKHHLQVLFQVAVDNLLFRNYRAAQMPRPKGEGLPCCPGEGACALGAACMAGQRWRSPAAITTAQGGTQATSVGNPWHH